MPCLWRQGIPTRGYVYRAFIFKRDINSEDGPTTVAPTMALQQEWKMRSSLPRALVPMAVLAVVVSLSTTPAVAGGWAWRGFAAWYGAEPPVRLGLPQGEPLRAIQGLYPYNKFGYNYGGWFAYQPVYGEWGH